MSDAVRIKNVSLSLADKDRLGQIIEKQGGLSYADLKRCHPCKNGQDFIEEANKIYERELFLRAMRNQMKQLRKIVGGAVHQSRKYTG